MRVADVCAGGLNGGSDGLHHPLHVFLRDTARTEDVAVGEVLGCEISDGELGEDNLGSGLVQGFHLLEDDLPFGVDYCLVFGNLLNPDFRIILLALYRSVSV